MVHDVTWSDYINSTFIKHAARDMIGDPVADVAQLRASSPVEPAAVWSMLQWVAPRCSNLAGVTLAFHESYYPTLGVAGILFQLEQIRSAVSRIPGADKWHSPNSSVPLRI
ncbi:MAG: hypothetical protein ABI593_03495 [Betaproteobacteria bacterium]